MGDCAFESSLSVNKLNSNRLFFLELTPACNNACHGCLNVFQSDRKKLPLDAKQWGQVILKLIDKVQFLKITGGEPTLHPEFEPILSLIDAIGFPFTLLTNGRWQDPQRLVNFLATLSGFRGFLISLHGRDCQTHDAFTGIRGSFAETTANIRLARSFGLKVSLSTVVSQLNQHQLTKMIGLAEALDCQSSVFNRYIGACRPGFSLETPAERQTLSALHQSVLSNPTRARFGTPLPYCFMAGDSSECLAGTAIATVDPWGNLRPCNHVPLRCGNLLESDLAEIWHGKPMEQWRKSIPLPCQDCPDFFHCKGGCRANILLRGLTYDPLLQKTCRTPADDHKIFSKAVIDDN